MGHLLMEVSATVSEARVSARTNGLVVDAVLGAATGTAEREAAQAMLGAMAGRHRVTLGADKAYAVAAFVAAPRGLKVTPHVAQNDTSRRSAVDRRTTRHPGYATSQRLRKRIEEALGWIKTIGGQARTRHRGIARAGWSFTLAAAACNLIRLPKLLGT